MPSMDGPGNRKMFEKFVGEKDGVWKINGNTEVRVNGLAREIILYASRIALWDGHSLTLCACGYATQTTMRKLDYLCLRLHTEGILPFRIGWRVSRGGVYLCKRNMEGAGKWDDVELPSASWTVCVNNVTSLSSTNYYARLHADTEALFGPVPDSLSIFKPLSFHQMKGVL